MISISSSSISNSLKIKTQPHQREAAERKNKVKKTSSGYCIHIDIWTKAAAEVEFKGWYKGWGRIHSLDEGFWAQDRDGSCERPSVQMHRGNK